MPFNDADFQAEDDMRTLAEAEAIARDPQRKRRAKAKAREKMKMLKDVVEDKEGESSVLREGFRRL